MFVFLCIGNTGMMMHDKHQQKEGNSKRYGAWVRHVKGSSKRLFVLFWSRILHRRRSYPKNRGTHFPPHTFAWAQITNNGKLGGIPFVILWPIVQHMGSISRKEGTTQR